MQENKSGVKAIGHHLRFHAPHMHIWPVFGTDWFALKAEGFARFFGTPLFLVAQTLVVLVWMGINALGYTTFDVYPFILLNLAFSLQAAYAAPLILLAQTRQADRDKAHAEADALHREALAQQAEKQAAQMYDLLQQNMRLTEMVKDLTMRIEKLTSEMHGRLLQP